MALTRPSALSKKCLVNYGTRVNKSVARISTSTRSDVASNEVLKPGIRLTHLTSNGAAHMVEIPPPFHNELATSGSSTETKPPTTRLAIARSVIAFSNPNPLTLIHSAGLKKGDALSVARIAGIMAAKQTATLIPLCHNISLSGVSIEIDTVEAGALAPPFLPSSNSSTEDGDAARGTAEQGTREPVDEFGGVVITARVRTHGQTGVEMEALTAATLAGLTVYDMCKAVDKGMRMEAVRVCLKEGGKSGRWVESNKA